MDNWTLLKRWWARTEAVEQAHFRACIKMRTWHYCLGGTLVVITTLESVLQNLVEADTKALIIALGIVAPILAALVTFLDFSKRSQQHHDAAARFSALKRSLQIEAANFDEMEKEQLVQTLNTIKKDWDKLTLESPALYKRKWSEIGDMDKSVEEVLKEHKHEKETLEAA
ncbi:SLATT domain-containing protein [Endozoicomonas arenosclerae]|uniref:SLATT domain-containing protein n=1 Tax=Endozoicomonas arenosclerae TaxID=1633495 RepID=UPI000782D9B1|nr:SLATT domain-containing protein [Endozoicomonas arenosclerae]